MLKFRIHYMKPSWFRNGICGDKPDVARLADTHTFLREVEVAGDAGMDTALDRIFYESQGEIWSPNGEASDLIRSKGLWHTSMSVGDVIEAPDGKLFVVASSGFTAL